MFSAHFKLTSQPFSEHTPAAALWPDERMNQGLARLHYLAEHATLGLVLGASGVGKSALLKRFLHGLRGPGTEAVYLHLTHLSAAALLKLLLCRLGEEPRRGKDRLFEQILTEVMGQPLSIRYVTLPEPPMAIASATVAESPLPPVVRDIVDLFNARVLDQPS